jgi:competence protein ComEA
MKKASLFLTLGLLLGLPLSAGAHPKAGATVRVSAAPRAAAPKTKAPVRPVNLNTATVTELMQLPKVGAKTAERIVSWRKEHGGFRRPEELMHVKGIGEKGFQRLKPYLQASAAVPTAVVRK